MASATTAAQRVLSTAELLENILRFLGEDVDAAAIPKQLFLLKRVDRFFNATISGSIKLRRLMYLELDPSAPKEAQRRPLLWLLRALGHSARIQEHDMELGGVQRHFSYIHLMGFNITEQLDGGDIDFYIKYEQEWGSWRNMKLGKADYRWVVEDTPRPLAAQSYHHCRHKEKQAQAHTSANR